MRDVFRKYRCEMTLALLTMLLLAAMEWCHPYFFLQDDNRTYHLPYYVHNLRSLLGGELPFFNFNQYMGTPVSFLSAPFYPINYLSMLLSRLFFGHYFASMEFIAVFHLMIAAIGFYCFSRSFLLEEVSCMLGAFAWAFSPFVITIGNSWIHTLGFAGYLPWMFLFSIRQLDRFTLSDSVRLLFVRCLAILLGYPQWVIYTVFFELLLLALLLIRSGDVTLSKVNKLVWRYCANYLALLVLSLPVLLQLVRESGVSFARNRVLSWEEYSLYSYRLNDWLHGLVAPFSDNGSHMFGELNYVSHVGYLTIIAAGAAVVICRKSAFKNEILIFTGIAVFSFLWSADIIVAKIFYYLPVFNKLRYPFKLQFFTSFFLITLSVFGFNSLMMSLRGKLPRSAGVVTAFVILLHILNFATLYTLFPQRSLSNHLDLPPFQEPLAEQLAGGRIVSAGPDVVWDGERVVPGHTVPTLGYNFAMLWGLHHFGGYEALLSERSFNAAMGLVNNSIFNVETGKPLNFSADVPLEYLRKWGVKWYIVNSRIPLAGTEGLKLANSDKNRNVLYDPAGKSLVYWSDGLDNVTPEFIFQANSVEIKTQRVSEGLLTVSVLYNPYFRAYLDSRLHSVAETEDGQMSIVVPAGNHTVQLKYIDESFRKGLLVSGSFLFGAVSLWWTVKLRKRSKQT